MRAAEYTLAALVIVDAVAKGTHELTPAGLAHLVELLDAAADDACEIEQRLARPDAANIVASCPALTAPVDASLLCRVEEPARALLDDLFSDAPRSTQAPQAQASNVVSFEDFAARWPRLAREADGAAALRGLHEQLVAHARTGEIGPKDGGSAA